MTGKGIIYQISGYIDNVDVVKSRHDKRLSS